MSSLVLPVPPHEIERTCYHGATNSDMLDTIEQGTPSLDRFGRRTKLRWNRPLLSGNVTLLNLHYGYDRDSYLPGYRVAHITPHLPRKSTDNLQPSGLGRAFGSYRNTEPGSLPSTSSAFHQKSGKSGTIMAFHFDHDGNI